MHEGGRHGDHGRRAPGRDPGAPAAEGGGANMKGAKSKVYREQSFELKGLDGISDAQVAEHLQLYAGYVKQVNKLNEEIDGLLGGGKALGTSPEFAELTRRLGFEYNGMILHEYYFSNLRKAADP